MVYLGLDLGTKTLGISKSNGVIATFYKTIRHEENYDYLIDELKKIIELEHVDIVVLGYPKNMNNTLGDAVERTISFKDKLEQKVNMEVHLVDERLSTVEAENYLINEDMRREDRKKVIDAVAASIILDTYLRMNKGE